MIVFEIIIHIFLKSNKWLPVFIGGTYAIYTMYGFLWGRDMYWLGSIPSNDNNIWLRFIIFIIILVYLIGITSLTYDAWMNIF